MGANAQTAVPVFTSGQVLTAEQVTQINTGIPVFATTTTRDAAFGGTGEKTLAEGQFAYIEATNTTQYYDGAAWQTVGASGLVLVSSTTVGNAVSSVVISSAFSATYDSYKIIYEGGTSSAACRLNMTLGSSTANYTWACVITDFTNAATASYNGNGATAWAVGASDANNTILNADVYDPFLTKQTYFSSYWFRDPGSNNIGHPLGFHTVAASYTAFTITPSTGTLTGGKIRVYGYANS